MYIKTDTIAIVGSQDWPHASSFFAKITISAAISFLKPTLVISGGCPRGVDKWVEEEWLERGAGGPTAHKVAFTEYFPEVYAWDPPEGKGFKQRNIEIAEACDGLVCIRSVESKTYGSGWTADYAERLGKLVWRFEH